MPVYMMYFERYMEMTIDAETREAALAAGEKACDENSVDEMCSYGDEWTVGISYNPTPKNTDQQGIKDGGIVHIGDAERGENDE